MLGAMAAPYRAHGELGATLPDPARPRLALGLVAVGGVASFGTLALLYLRPFDVPMAVSLSLSGAAIVLGLAIAGWSSRSLLAVGAAVVLALAYFNGATWTAILGHPLPPTHQWPARYAAIAAGAVALLSVYRRLQRRSFGFPLRVAAVVGFHWATVRGASLFVPGAAECAEVELVARSSWLLLGVGAWQLRRWIGVSLPVEPGPGDLGAVISTRLAAASLSLSVRLALLFGVASLAAIETSSVAADFIGGAVALGVEVPALMRVAPRRITALLALSAFMLTPILLVSERSTTLIMLPILQVIPPLLVAAAIRKLQPTHMRVALVALAVQAAAAPVAILVQLKS